MDYMTSAMLFLVTCIVTIFIGSLHARSRKSNYKLPPGPSFFTIMSNVVELYNKPQQTLAKLAKFYGPIMRIKCTETTIIISSSHMAKEILFTNDSLFTDRSVPDNTTTHNHNNFSLVFLPFSPLWQHLRKICHNNLFSTKTLDGSQELRRMKLKDLLNDMHKSSITGEAVDVGRAAFKACINFLSYTFVSQDFVENLDDEYKNIVSTLLSAVGTPNIADHFPVLKIFDPQGIRRHTTLYVSKVFYALDIIIDQRMKMRQSEQYISKNDMLDALLDISKEDGQKMDKRQIKHLLLDLLVAGTETSAYGLERAMSEVVRHPEVMSKAKKELEETIGLGKPIEESDIDRLPYLNAVIKESLRLHPPAPMLLPRKARVDVDLDWFQSDSRIIVITRDKQVLIANEVDDDDVYEVGVLNSSEALALFNLNAFKQSHLEMKYYELSKRVIEYAKGVPLVLKVFAHMLRGRHKEEWESRLDRLKRIPIQEVDKVMRLNYDDLDRLEQKYFLDIACFFNGLNLKVDYMKHLLRDSDSDNSVAVVLERLQDKALITISEYNVISMHDIFQEMGREVVRQEYSEDPRKCSHLWDPDIIYDVLKNDKGTDAIRSIRVDLSSFRELELSPHVFAKMTNLRYLDFHGKYDLELLPQGLQFFPNDLRYLHWMHYPLKSFPEKFSAENLVILNLLYSQVEKLWCGVQPDLVNLKEVTLSHSGFLKELPNFSKAENLNVLHIEDCPQLESVHPSIFCPGKLVKLYLFTISH